MCPLSVVVRIRSISQAEPSLPPPPPPPPVGGMVVGLICGRAPLSGCQDINKSSHFRHVFSRPPPFPAGWGHGCRYGCSWNTHTASSQVAVREDGAHDESCQKHHFHNPLCLVLFSDLLFALSAVLIRGRHVQSNAVVLSTSALKP